MKKTLATIAIVFAIGHTALGQGSFATPINTTALTTNSYTLQYLLTVTGQFTNLQALTWNTNYQITGDAPPIPTYKINAGFSNAWQFATGLSNATYRAAANFLVLSNNFVIASNNFLITSNGLSALLGNFGNLTNAWASFIASYAPGIASGAAMNFDSGNITSDGSGNATFVSVFSQQLKDSGGSTGSSGNYAQANGSGGWTWTTWPATLNFDSSDITSDGSGNITAGSFKGSLRDNSSGSGASTYVPTANGDGSWTWQPGGGGGSVSLPTNLVYSVYSYPTYQTNYAFWRAGSNFLATVAGLYSWSISGGDDGGNPPFQMPVSLIGTYDGTTFFPISSGFSTSNTISVYLWATNSASDPNASGGGHQVDPGRAVLYTLNDWSHAGALGLAVNLSASATTNYVAAAVANAMVGQWTSSRSGLSLQTGVTWAGSTALNLSFNQSELFRSWSIVGTNILIGVAVTNLTPGWALYSSTNLDLQNGFSVTTNYSTNITSGICTFTIPILPNAPQYFFDPRSAAIGTAAFNVPVAFNSGTLFPSNTFNLFALTNGMPDRSFLDFNSNGICKTTLFLSNGVVRFTRIAP